MENLQYTMDLANVIKLHPKAHYMFPFSYFMTKDSLSKTTYTNAVLKFNDVTGSKFADHPVEIILEGNNGYCLDGWSYDS
jgi:hypothetical protein